MSGKANLLVVGDYSRRDFLDMFKSCCQDFDLYFIEHASAKEVMSLYYKEYGQALFWKDFTHAFDLLDKIKPIKVLFFFIEAYNHVALNVACKERGITTCVLDHGVRDININVTYQATQPLVTGRMFHSKRISLFERLKTRLFFVRTVRKVSPNYRAFLKLFYKTRGKYNFYETSQLLQSPLRKPDVYLSFSTGVFEAHKKLDLLEPQQKVYFFGIPYFDELSKLKVGAVKAKNILFIDQAFVKQQLLGWDNPYKCRFITELLAICSQQGYKLLVKTHPLEDKTIWHEFAGPHLQLVDTDFHGAILNSRVVIGFYSTLLLGLAALPHTLLITFEGHPVGNLSLSSFITDQKVGTAIYDLTELQDLLHNTELLHQQQVVQKERFIEKWLYKFDGRASERLRNLLLQEL